MKLKIDEEYRKIVPKLSGEDFRALRIGLEDVGQIYPVIVNKDGIILDGMHRFEILEELGKETKYEVRNFLTKQAEVKFVIEVNLQRRHLNDFQKARMGMVLKKVGHMADSQVADRAGVALRTLKRAKVIIEDGPEEIKELCEEKVLAINTAYNLTRALKDVPEESKKTLIKQLVEGSMEPKEIHKAIASTNAIKAQLEGEEEDVREKAEALFKDKYYTKELGCKEAIWQIEEIAEDPHNNITREFPLDKFATFKDAQAWAVERDGVCQGKIEKWLVNFDPLKDKKLEEEKKDGT